MNELWDWGYTGDILPDLLQAFLKYTLGVTAAGAIIAIVLGLVFAITRRSESRPLSVGMRWVIEFIRSTPIPVQLFFVYFAFPSFGLNLSAVTTGVIVFGLHYACYMAEVYRAGIDAVPKGQWEACTALSLSPQRTWQVVILPQVVRRVLPSIGNQVIALFKETPFMIVIGVPEMVTTAQQLGAENFRFVEPITIAGLIFLAASYPTAVLMRKLEVRLGH